MVAMLDYRYLSFLELSKELNYTTTAKNLFLTQPTITKHIQSIETELNVKLVEYKNKQLLLTDAGQYLSKELSLVLEEINHLKQNLSKQYNSQPLMIGASHAIGEYFLSQHTDLFSQVSLDYNLLIENPKILLEKLQLGEIDCALISDDIKENSNLVIKSFYEDNLVLATSSENFSDQKELSMTELSKLPLIFREKESGLFKSITRQFTQKDIKVENFQNVRYIGNIKIAKNMIKNEHYYSFFHKTTIEKELIRPNCFIEIPISGIVLKQHFNLVHKQNQTKIDKLNELYRILINEKD